MSTIECVIVSSEKLCCSNNTYLLEYMDKIGSVKFLFHVAMCVFLVLVSGLMSGLTLGLLGLDTNTLEILANCGTEKEKKYASRILPICKKHHLLLVTLLLVNATSMEALPLYLDMFTSSWVSLLISVTAVLLLGEILPQAIFSRWPLSIGGNIYWLVWLLIFLTFPISWPISKLLDYLIGYKHSTLYKRAQLKEFVGYHAAAAFETLRDMEELGHLPSEERLTEDEVLIIKGALDLTSKTVKNVMTPIDKVYCLPNKLVINETVLQSIMNSGHSRIPIYQGVKENLIGMFLVKNLTLKFILSKGNMPLVEIKELPLVGEFTPLYTMLNIFQTGKSHIAGVVDENGRSIGIVTLEDVIEELIQEEIEDEMDLWRKNKIGVRLQKTLSSI